ncbi:MAG: Ig-like domain-containing protein [Lachnospiraceae bacterium]|nr:Ig-like domain-containing protein [Lachnospiraceae bacterium]
MSGMVKKWRCVVALILVVTLPFSFSKAVFSIDDLGDIVEASENDGNEIIQTAEGIEDEILGDNETQGDDETPGDDESADEPIIYRSRGGSSLSAPLFNICGDMQNGYYKGSATITLANDDDIPPETSVTIYYEINGNGRQPYTAPIEIDLAGDYNITAVTVDNDDSNNESELASADFTVKSEWAQLCFENLSYSIYQGGTITIPFEVKNAAAVSITAFSDDSTMLPASAFSISENAPYTISINVPAGTDQGNYTITLSADTDDGATPISTAFTLTVTEADAPQVAAIDTFKIRYNENVSFDFSSVSADINGLPLSYSIVPASFNGSASFSGSTLTYTPDANAATENLTVRVSNGLTYTDKTITIMVFEEPIVPRTPWQATTDEDTPLQIDLNGLCSDSRGQELKFEIASQPINGQVSILNGILTYTPDDDFFTELLDVEEIGITVSHKDSDFYSETFLIHITVNPVEDAPIAVDDDDSYNVDSNGFILINVLQNDISVDGKPLKIRAIEIAPQKASLCIIEDNKIYYKPDPRESGSDTFTYSVIHEYDDGDGILFDTAEVTVNINTVNNLQSITLNNNQVTINEDEQLVFRFKLDDIDSNDIENDFDLEITSTNLNVFAGDTAYTITKVWADADTVNYIISCDPVAYANTTEHGSVSLLIRIIDKNDTTMVATASQTVVVTPVDNAPVVYDYPDTTLEDEWIWEDGFYTLNFFVYDLDIIDPLNNLDVTVTSADQSVLPNSRITRIDAVLVDPLTVKYTYKLTPLQYRFNEAGFKITITATSEASY